MSLKNRNETKLLMENWRKVLKEGLYDNDPELLEEGLKEIGLTALAALPALLPSVSQAKIPGQTEKDQNQSIIGLFNQASEYSENVQRMNLSRLERETTSEKIENIIGVIKAIKDTGNRTLSPEQEEILTQGQVNGKELIKAGKARYEKAKKAVEAASEKLKSLGSINSLSSGDILEIENAKGDLAQHVGELERSANYLKGIFGIPKSVQYKMSDKHKHLSLPGEVPVYNRKTLSNQN